MKKMVLAILVSVFFVVMAVVVFAADKPGNIYIGCPDNLQVEVYPGGFLASWSLSAPTTPVDIILFKNGQELKRDTIVNDNMYSLSGLGSGQYILLVSYPRGTMSAEKHFYISAMEYRIYQNYPNPFNSSTTISYALAKRSHTRVTIYNCLGQEVKTLVDEFQAPGLHQVVWKATNCSSGIYYYRVDFDGFYEVRRMVLTE